MAKTARDVLEARIHSLADVVMRDLDAAGYAIVPKEPTDAMCDAAGSAFLGAIKQRETGENPIRPFRAYYCAMIGAWSTTQ